MIEPSYLVGHVFNVPVRGTLKTCPTVWLGGFLLCAALTSADSPKRLDPASWGGDHVGKPVPEFTTGDECLFCHRLDVGPGWKDNRHNRTVRDAEAGEAALAALKKLPQLERLAGEVKLVLGNGTRQRFLKPAEAFGKLDLLSVEWTPPQHGKAGELLAADRPHWDAKKFGDSCVGCHASAVDSNERTFAARSLDCSVCHGEVSAEHTKNPALAFLSPKRKDAPRVVTSICAQCHLRTGKSKSSGLPYANNFVAGDNLFRDFQVDFSDEAIKRLNPADAHVLDNVRDVVVLGKEAVTCLSCHDVHKPSARKHHLVPADNSCLHCHQATGSRKLRKEYEIHSQTCGY